MNAIKSIMLLFLVIFFNQAYAINVPFQNLTMNPNGVLKANFAFGPHQIIFCFANNISNVVSLTWPFRGKPVSAQMPLALKTRANVDGQFSDSSGVLTLQNTPNHGPAQVSCVFGFKNVS